MADSSGVGNGKWATGSRAPARVVGLALAARGVT